MEFTAKARYVKYSPYKLRPIADVIRGKNVSYAFNWLSTYQTKRVVPLKKLLASAIANAKDRENANSSSLVIKEVRIDNGPFFKYFLPASHGRAEIQRRRFCHISIILNYSKKAKEA